MQACSLGKKGGACRRLVKRLAFAAFLFVPLTPLPAGTTDPGAAPSLPGYIQEKFSAPEVREAFKYSAASELERTPGGVKLKRIYPGSSGTLSALKPEEIKALESLAARDNIKEGELPAFTLGDELSSGYSIDYKGKVLKIRHVLKGVKPAMAFIEDGAVVYPDAHKDTSVLYVLSPGRCQEMLLLASEKAPREFEYEYSEEVGLNGKGEITAGGLTLSRPVIFDASGRRVDGFYRKKAGNRVLLSFNSAGLVYPLLIDPTWQASAASMTAARYSHTATLLPNGKVLITGGRNGAAALSTAELYDPAVGTFSATGSMSTGRMGHSATLLPNGKVLIAGGVANNLITTLSSAELYDPATGVFSATGSMGATRNSHVAVLLPNGKVLIAGGGLDNVTATLASAELYDPDTGIFSATGAMSAARQQCPGILLPNGKVLIVGGFSNNVILSSSEMYDPAAGTFSATGSMAAARWRHAAVLMPNGKVLVAGGANPGGTLSSAELYDPAAGTFSATGPLNGLRQAYAAILLPNGKVLITGGSDGAINPAWADLYDPAAGTFSVTSSMSSGRSSLSATLLSNGKVLVTGGHNGSAAVASADLYALSGGAGTFSATGSMSATRFRQSGTMLPNGKVLIVGGANGGGTLSSAELYDPATGAFSATGAMSGIRQGPMAILLPNGKVLVFGGADASAAVSSAEVYDPVAGAFSATGSMNTARSSPAAILLPNGKVLVAGGHNGISGVSSAELYDPAAGTFSGTGSMSTVRYLHTATLLRNGKVLIVGGRDNVGSISSSELYDPATGTFSVTGSLAAARRFHTSTLLPTGKVLVAGGTSGSHLSSAELYDPAAGTFSATGSMGTVRTEYSAILLPIGKVLVAGGWDGTLCHSSAELYDPAAGIFSATGLMSSARDQYSVTLLPNGKVLAAGGDTCGTTTSSAELYDVFFGSAGALSPGALTNLAASSASYVGALTLSWGASGNDGDLETLATGSSFYVQYSTYSSVSWSTAAAQVVQSTSGVTPSTLVRYNLGGLDPGTTYYLAVWHKDEDGNLSGISNIASAYAKPFPSLIINKTVNGDGTWHLDFGPEANPVTSGLAIDAAGNIYAAGQIFNGSNVDLFVHKYDASGDLLAAKYFNGADNCTEAGTPSVAVDTVTGAFYMAGAECSVTSTYADLLIKYDAGGQVEWRRRIVGNSSTPGQGLSVVRVDPSGNVYIAGNISNGGGRDSWVGKFSPDGNPIWASTKAYSANYDWIYDLAVQGGYAYAAGSADMSGIGQGQNATLWKLDINTGLTVWTTYYTGAANRHDDAVGVVVDTSSYIYLVGDEQVALNDYALLSQKRNSSGVIQWTVRNNFTPGASTNDAYSKVVLSTDNYLYEAGNIPTPSHGDDLLVTKRDLSGALLGTYTYDLNAGNDAAVSLALSGEKLIIGGYETMGGVKRHFIRRMNASDVKPPDTTPPTAAILQPAAGSYLNSMSLVAGTAFDDVEAASVTVSVRNIGDGLYWDGSEWTASQAWLDAAVFSSSWTYSGMPLWVDGTTYTVNARAMDSSGNWSLIYATSTFHFESELPAGCAQGFNVRKDGSRDFITIQAAVDALPRVLNADTCVVVRDTQTYTEQVTVRGFTSNGYRLKIMADPAFVSSMPVVSPPAASTAAFNIANASVTLQGFKISLSANLPYLVLASSPDFTLDGMVVNAGNSLQTSPNRVVTIGDRSTISNTAITAITGQGLTITGSMNTVANSTVTVDYASGYALSVAGSSNTVTQSYFSNTAAQGSSFGPGSDGNTIQQSTFTGMGALQALIIGGSFNSITQSYVFGGGGGQQGLVLSGLHNSVSQSMLVSDANLGLIAGSSHTVTQCYIEGGAFLAGTGTSIAQSTITNSYLYNPIAAEIDGSSNTITESYISNTFGGALMIWGGDGATGAFNTISRSTMIGGGPNQEYCGLFGCEGETEWAFGLYVRGLSNTVTDCVIKGSTAAHVTGSTATVINSSVLVATGAAGSGLWLTAGNAGFSLSSNTVTGGVQGAGIFLDAYNSGTIALSSNTINGGLYGLNIATQGAGAAFSIASMTFSSLTAGATAINFLGGTFVSTFTAVAFNSAGIAVNVNASPLNAASRITMKESSGASEGPAYENDPAAVVDWGTGAGCAFEKTVKQAGGGDCTTIQACIDLIPASLTGDWCIDIQDSAAYQELPVVRNRTTNGFRIILGAMDAANRPSVHSNGLDTDAVIKIANSSVTVQNLIVNQPIGYNGILVSSPNAVVDQVFVDYAGQGGFGPGQINAAISISSWTTVTRSSISVNSDNGVYGCAGLKITGTGSVVSSLTVVGSGMDLGNAVWLYDASSNTITQSYISNDNCYGLTFGSNGGTAAHYNTVSYSTITSGNAIGGCSGLHIAAGTYNNISRSYISNSNGRGVLSDTIDGPNSFSAIDRSTVAAAGSYGVALDMYESYSFAVSRSLLSSSSGEAVFMNGGSASISESTVSSQADGLSALYLYYPAEAAISDSYISGSSAAYVHGGSGVTISSSVLTGTGASAKSLSLVNAANANLDSVTLNGGPLLWDGNSTLNMSGVTFQGLQPGATAIDLISNAAYVATFYGVNFADPDIAVNINGSLVDAAFTGSLITVLNSYGPRTGPGFENDPQSFVDWPGLLPDGCGTGFNVRQDGGANFTGLQAAVNALPKSLASDACVVVRDTQTYSEQVTVEGFSNNGYRLKILIDPSFVSSAPVVSPPAASNAAFRIKNDGVTISGFGVVPVAALPYGIRGSSDSLEASGITVLDPGGIISTAGIALSTGSALSNSTVTVGAANGVYLNGSGNTVTLNRINGGGSSAGLRLLQASNNTISQNYVDNPTGYGAQLGSGSDNNIISFSTFTANSVYMAFNIDNSDLNSVANCYISNPSGYGAFLGYGADDNTISSSTVLSNAANYFAVKLLSSASNTVTQSYISNPPGVALTSVFGGGNLVSYSTVTSGAWAYNSVFIDASDYNTVRNSLISGANGLFIRDSTGTAVFYNVLTATNTAGTGLRVDTSRDVSASYNTVSAPATGILLNVGNTGLITLASNTVSGAKYGLSIDNQPAALAISGLNFASLPPSTTAINFLGGTFVSTFTGIGFNDTDIGVNVDGSLLGASSRITMRDAYGPKYSSSYERDPAGYVDWEPDTDNTPPSAAILQPQNYSYRNSLALLAGTAADNVLVSSVQVGIMRQSDSYYWDGAVWAASQSWLDASVAAPAWSYAVLPAWVNGASYRITAKAGDSSSNWSTIYSTSVFYYDSGVPVSAITAPAASSFLTTFSGLAGTAWDNESFAHQAEVKIRRISDGYYWDGAAWAASETWNLAVGSFTWTYTGLTEASLTNGVTYYAVSRASDTAGNVQTAEIGGSTFVYTGAYGDILPPAVRIISPINSSYVTALSSITGTASDNVAVSSVVLSIWRSDTGLYWDGSQWSAGQAWLNAALFPSSWTYSNIPALVSGWSYTVVSKTRDTAGNWSAVYSTSSFIYLIPTDHAEFYTPARRLVAGTTVQYTDYSLGITTASIITVALKDANGDVTVSTSDITVRFSSPRDTTYGGLDPASPVISGNPDWQLLKTSPIDILLRAGQSYASIYVWDTMAGTTTVSAEASGGALLSLVSQDQNITPSSASYFTLQHYNGSGNPLRVATPGYLTLSVKDRFGNIAAGDAVNGQYYTGKVNLSVTPAAGADIRDFLADATSYTFVPSDHGQRTLRLFDIFIDTVNISAADNSDSSINGYTGDTGRGSSGGIPLSGILINPRDLAPEDPLPANKTSIGVVAPALYRGEGLIYFDPSPAPMLRLTIRTAPSGPPPAYLKSVRVRSTGTLASSDIAWIGMYRDNDAAGQLGVFDCEDVIGGSPTDILMSSGTYNTGLGAWIFDDLNAKVSTAALISNTPHNFFFAVRLSTSAIVPRTFGLVIDDPSFIVIASSDIGVAGNNFPIATATSPVRDSRIPMWFSGVAVGISSITWAWENLQDEPGYKVSGYGESSGNLAPDVTQWTETSLLPNTGYLRSVFVLYEYPASSMLVRRYTLAVAPSSAAFSGVASSVTFSWSGDANPGTTLYEYEISLSSAFSVIAASGTRTAASAWVTGLTAGAVYYGRVRAINGDGIPTAYNYVSPVVLLEYYNPPPTVSILQPQNYSYRNSLAALSGTAADDVQVSSVQVGIMRLSDGYYWNGAAWAAGESRLEASLSAPAWSLSTLPAWENGASYRVSAAAIDNAGRWSAVYSTSVFYFDSGLPASAVTVPASGTTVPSFSGLGGTAWDAESFTAQIWVGVKRATDDLYWNGAISQWTVAQAWNLAAGSATWTYAGLPEGALTSGTTYFAVSRVTDLAGNLQISEALVSTFTYIVPPPPELNPLPFTAVAVSSLTVNWESTYSTGTVYYVRLSTHLAASPVFSSTTFAASQVFTGLIPNTTYFGFVSTMSGANYMFMGAEATLAMTPSSVTIVGVSYSSASITWSVGANPPQTYYLFQMSVSSSFATTLPAVYQTHQNQLVVSQLGLAEGTTYYGRLRAYNSSWIPTPYVYLGPVVTLVHVSPATGAVSGLLGTVLGTSSVTWTWNGGSLSNADSYGIFSSTGALLGTVAYSTGASYTQTGLSANTPVSVGIAGYGSEGYAGLAVSATYYTFAAPPGTPAISARGDTAVTLGWEVSGNPAGTVYQLWRDAGAAFTQPVISTTTLSSHTVSGLAPGTQYYFKARAMNGDGVFSDFSAEVSTFTMPLLPAQPAAPSGSAAGVSSITWTWAAVSGVTGYRVYAATAQSVLLASPSSPAYAQEGLSPNTTYSIVAAGLNASGEGPVSPAAVPVATLAKMPSGVSIAAVYATSATLTWGLNGNPAGTTAKVLRVNTATTFTTSGLNLTDTGLLGCTSYYFRVWNVNRANAPTQYEEAGPAFTGSPTPLPPGNLSATSLAGYRIALSWEPAPFEGITSYNLYYDNGTGTINYDTPLASLTPLQTSYTTGMLTSVAYKFGLRALHRCGMEEKNTGVVASATGLYSLTGVRAAIKIPQSGKKVNGNSVTVMAELITGTVAETKNVRLQYKASSSSTWLDIPAKDPGQHPNPDSTSPYFIHWDVSGLAGGSYDLRAIATDLGNVSDASPAAVTIAVDAAEADITENVTAGKVTKEQKVNNLVTNTLQAADPVSTQVTKLEIPAGALDASTATVSVTNNPAVVPPAPADAEPAGIVTEVTLSNQSLLAGGQTAVVTLLFPDADNDGIVDGTSLRASQLEMYSAHSAAGPWQRDLSSVVDLAGKKVVGYTTHFSFFALFAPQAVNINSARAYPVPWRPGSGGRFDSAPGTTGITFDNLTDKTEIKIYTVAGQLVQELKLTAADLGVKVWDGKNSAGVKAASGVYLAHIRSGSAVKVLKIAVER